VSESAASRELRYTGSLTPDHEQVVRDYVDDVVNIYDEMASAWDIRAGTHATINMLVKEGRILPPGLRMFVSSNCGKPCYTLYRDGIELACLCDLEPE
jgi:hypothetical protein